MKNNSNSDDFLLIKKAQNGHEGAFNFLMTPQIIGNSKRWEDKETGMKCLLGKWNDHYRSWTRDKSNLLLIKYEDLIKNPENELEKIINI